MTDFAPLLLSISQAIKMVGLGRTSFYAAISAGKIRIKKYGRRTLVEMDSLRAFVDALPSGTDAVDPAKDVPDTRAANTTDFSISGIIDGGDKT